MGLDVNAIRFLLDARQRGVSFECVATLGRQALLIDEDALHSTLADYGLAMSRKDAAAILTEAEGFCEPLVRLLGAREICSIDVSSYQQASFQHDMNDPIPTSLMDRFTAVIDGGSLEHVFNFPRAIANCMQMLRVGGHHFATTPANNFMGHGFYQFSPELFYRVFSPDNGFAVERMVAYQECWPYVWHDVLDPEQVRQRVTLINRYPTYLLVEGKKVDAVVPFSKTPQQSDYVVLWKQPGRQVRTAGTVADGGRSRRPSTASVAAIRARVGRLVPETVKARYRTLRQGGDPFDARFFRKVARERLR